MAGLKSKYSVYVVFAGKKVKMPVNPEEVNIKYPTDHKTYRNRGSQEAFFKRAFLGILFSWKPEGTLCEQRGQGCVFLC